MTTTTTIEIEIEYRDDGTRGVSVNWRGYLPRRDLIDRIVDMIQGRDNR